MGYSATKAAFDTLNAVAEIARGDQESSNTMPDGGFWEMGKEQPDGAITGTVWKPYRPNDPNDTRVIRRGGFRIEANGLITRFPGLTKSQRQEAEDKANGI